MVTNQEELEKFYIQSLDNDIIKYLADKKNIELIVAMDIYYKSLLCKQIHNGENGIQYLEMKIRSISKLGWEKGSLSLRWQREIHRSTTSESSVIRAFFCVPYRKESSFRQKKPCRICSICVSMPVNFRKSLQKTKWQRST